MLVLLLVAAFVGALSGALAALIVTPYRIVNTTRAPSSTRPVVTAPTSTEVGPALVALAPHLQTSLVPPGFTRRSSPVATIYHKPRGVTVDERSLTDDRMLGQAVALTSDGWFVTTQSVIGILHVADLSLWHEGVSFPVQRAVLDHTNGTVYLKVQANGLTAPVFGRIPDLALGSEMWLERRAQVFAPSLLTSLNSGLPSIVPVSSEVAVRRLQLDGVTAPGDQGSPAWDSDGALLGIIESAPGETLRAVPASSLSASFGSFLANGEIRHATLGVRTVDLLAWRIDGDRGALPLRGALLKDDRRAGKPAIALASPAAKAGLKAGDVIVGVERDILDGNEDVGEILSEYRPDTRVIFHLDRAGTAIDVPVTLGSAVTSEALK